jgi:VWFA-related protein
VRSAGSSVSRLVLLSSIAFSGSRSVAQNVQPPALQIPSAIAEVVVVDAYVTDSKNRPVTDLRKEDFELREDSQPVEITAFQGPSPAPAEAESGTKPTAAGATPAPAPTAPPEPFTVAIYVDRWLLSPAGRKRAIDQAIILAESHIARGARVTVIAEDKGLRPFTPLTSDPAVIREALTRVQGWATQSPGESESRNVIENIKARIDMAEQSKECNEPPACVCVLPSLLTMVRGYATFRAVEVQQVSERLSFLVNALRGIAGRKALVYVSEGLEQRPGIQIYDQLTTICPEVLHKDASSISAAMQEIDASSVLAETVARANAARVSFYPIDARGLSGLSSADIERGDRRYVASAKTDGVKDANLVNQYRYLAEQTGGFAMIRGLDPAAAMRRFDADARGHYVLGFVPDAPDGRTHSLFVGLVAKIRNTRNLDVRFRQSYFRAVLPARRGQRALSALLFGLEDDALHVRVSVGRTAPETARIHIGLPLTSLKPIDGVSPPEGRVQVVLSFRKDDAAENDVTVREKTVSYSLEPAELARDAGEREIVIELPVSTGGYEFAIGVEDLASGASSYLRSTLKAS